MSLLDGSPSGFLWPVEVDCLPMSLEGCFSCKNEPWLSVLTVFLTFLVEILALADAVTIFHLLVSVSFPLGIVKIIKITKSTKTNK